MCAKRKLAEVVVEVVTVKDYAAVAAMTVADAVVAELVSQTLAMTSHLA